MVACDIYQFYRRLYILCSSVHCTAKMDARCLSLVESQIHLLHAEEKERNPASARNSRWRAQKLGGLEDGKRRFSLLWSNLARIEETYLRLSKQQRHIIEEFARASLVKIIGIENYERNPMFFMNLAKKTNRQSLSIVITPRRFGKTTATAMYVAALLMTVPSIVVAIFSTGRRASTLLLQKISQIVVSANRDKRILQSNQETLKISGDFAGDERTCHSYPSNVATLKGVGCDIGIMENLRGVTRRYGRKSSSRCWGVNGTSIVAISTPLGEDNWCSDLIQTQGRRDAAV